MKVLIDLSHPAHVHLFRNLYFRLCNKGHDVFVTVKDIQSVKDLLNHYKIKYFNLGEKKDSIFAKGVKQLVYDRALYKFVKNNGIEIGISSSITIPHVSLLTKMQSIVLDDDDDSVEPLFVRFGHPFCDFLLSPEALKGHRQKNDTIYYAGNHELAYLHPNQFTPDKNILKEIGINLNEKYFVLRFNSFKAHHDIGNQGLSLENKRKLITLLKPYGKIFITTERRISPEFEEFQLKIEPHKIHSLLFFATLFIGDSQTMTSEAAMLGTPAIRSNSFVGRLACLEEEEGRYNLAYGYKPDESDKMFEGINNLLVLPNLKEEWQSRRRKMLEEKIDVTAFLLWFVEHCPDSAQILRDIPEYQDRFR